MDAHDSQPKAARPLEGAVVSKQLLLPPLDTAAAIGGLSGGGHVHYLPQALGRQWTSASLHPHPEAEMKTWWLRPQADFFVEGGNARWRGRAAAITYRWVASHWGLLLVLAMPYVGCMGLLPAQVHSGLGPPSPHLNAPLLSPNTVFAG